MQTHKFDRAYIQTNTRARSASAQSTSITLIVDWRPLLQVVGGDIETVIVSGERAGFPGPELGAVAICTPEALKADVKKTYDPSILVARPAST